MSKETKQKRAKKEDYLPLIGPFWLFIKERLDKAFKEYDGTPREIYVGWRNHCRVRIKFHKRAKRYISFSMSNKISSSEDTVTYPWKPGNEVIGWIIADRIAYFLLKERTCWTCTTKACDNRQFTDYGKEETQKT